MQPKKSFLEQALLVRADDVQTGKEWCVSCWEG